MKLVKFARQAGVISIQFEITGLVTWRYKYVSDDYSFVRTCVDPGPATHALGLPHEVDCDTDSWDVQIANSGDQPAAYTVRLTWEQGGTILDAWNAHGTVPPGHVQVERGDAFLIGV